MECCYKFCVSFYEEDLLAMIEYKTCYFPFIVLKSFKQ